MRSISTTALLLFFFATWSFGQELTQTVRGAITDTDSKLPLIGAIVKVQGSNPIIGATTDENGEFRLEKIPVGRISLELSFSGYETKIIPDIEVNSGKENVLNFTLQESIQKLDEVNITANNKEKGDPVNDMSLLSTRSISLNETKRYAGSFNDPSKILSNFAGVATTSGDNDIIVRGNSPKYIQWRLEGVEISNPTHFADQNSIKGGISALNNSLLATSDFSTGAFSPEYGDVLSGVYDVRMRAGNNENFEASVGLGIIGTDVTLEGPFKKGYRGSYLVNYRYSTVSLISNLGLVKIDGALNFQDGAFKIVLPTKRMGDFSFFGLGGLSGFTFENVKPDFFITPTNTTNTEEISEDYDKKNHLSTIGMNHTIMLNDRSSLKTSFSYANNGITEDIFKTTTSKSFDSLGVLLSETISDPLLDYKSRLRKATIRGSVTYNTKFNAKNTLQIGTKYALLGYDYNLSYLDSSANRFTAVDLDKGITTIRNFVSWKHRLNDNITIVTGFHNMNVLLNNKSTLEPRFAVNWKINKRNSINAGYGKHSSMESVHNYFAKVALSDGTVVEPNQDLDLLKADHFVIGYENKFTKNMRAKIEVYYQHLYNLPVENNDTSYYATINEGVSFRYVDLVNEGTGKNYGIELTIERFFVKNYYFMFNASLFNSRYKSLEGIERNTQYNSNYLINLLAGKEFVKMGKKENQTLNINAKIFFGGGQKIIPLLRDTQGNLAVNPATNQFWDYDKAYTNSLQDMYQITLSASYKWNKNKATHELFVNLDNITNTQSNISEYYDQTKDNSVGYIKQFGLFPNLMYRVYF